MNRPNGPRTSTPEPAWLNVPPDHSPLAPILRIEPAGHKDLAILSPRIEGVWIHWYAGRTLPCTGEQGQCWCDHAETSRRWQGWLAVQGKYGMACYWLALGAAAVRDCPMLYRETASIRGRIIVVSRPNGGRQGKVIVRPLAELMPETKLFRAPDTRDFLLRLWGKWVNAGDPPAEGNGAK